MTPFLRDFWGFSGQAVIDDRESSEDRFGFGGKEAVIDDGESSDRCVFLS